MKHRLAMLLLCSPLMACGSIAPNSDAPLMGGGHVQVVDNAPITVTETGPAVGAGGQRVFGTSCKNVVWDPAPSAEAAIALMKGAAFTKGFNAVHSIKTEKMGGAFFMNCWSAISASGIAYHLAAPVIPKAQ